MKLIHKAVCIKDCAATYCRHKEIHDCTGEGGSCGKAPCRPLDDVLKNKTGARYQGARRSRCAQGHNHQSGLEMDVCNDLHVLKNAGAIDAIIPQYKIELVVYHSHITNHFVDFRVEWNESPAKYLPCNEYASGLKSMVTFIEAKGAEAELWIIKHRLTEALFPSIPYITLKKRIFK